MTSETGSRRPGTAGIVADIRSARLAAYHAYRNAYPDRFTSLPGGVDVITDAAGIAAVEREVGAAYAARGLPPAWAEVGLMYEDPYLLLLRDAVRFPDGRLGVHHRVMRRSADPSGVAVLPLIGDRIVLVRHFRHPLRRWSLEVPRGAIDPGENAADAAHREMAEEIAARVLDVQFLGHMHGATGFMGIAVALFIARLDGLGATALSEGIDGTRLVSAAEFESLVRSSEITDSFTLGCFLHARLAGLV